MSVVEGHGDAPKQLAYADPPYPGLARRYYGGEPSFAGEVDHKRLLEQLATFDGWALSTSRKALRDVLSFTPRGDDVIVCPWVKTHGAPPARGPSNIHEYVIVHPARRRLPGVPDAFVGGHAHSGGSSLMGRKPIRFVHWVFGLLGALPVDSLADLYPGSGVVGRCWGEFQRRAVLEQTSRGTGATSAEYSATSNGAVSAIGGGGASVGIEAALGLLVFGGAR
jgi:hypothetical protein